jgi:hypothetical protein
MIHRCSEGSQDAVNYFHRGIRVCERWEKFENFLEDMGERPRGLTVERVDNNLGYCMKNCIWATRKVQANNTRGNVRFPFMGGEFTAVEIDRKLGRRVGTTSSRVAKGWKFEDVINHPVGKWRAER